MDQKNYHKGYDIFYFEPGAKEFYKCLVCKNDMLIDKDVFCHTNSTSAMFRQPKVKKDVFYCQYSDTDWHNQALEILKLIEDNPSKTLTDLLEKELIQIIEQRKTTK